MTDYTEERKKEIVDLKVVASSKNGRSFLWSLLSRCGIYRDDYSPDNGLMKYNAGRRSIGLELLDLMNDCDDELIYKIAKEVQHD